MALYRAKGKFLITGEYLVMKGAKALAIPLRYGQSMSVEENFEAALHWGAFENGKLWFDAKFENSKFAILHTNQPEIAEKLAKLLTECRKQNPEFIIENDGISVRIDMDFDRNWGLGSSSTLIALLAQWSRTNPYQILNNTFGGSGYDIACAIAEGPIFYQLNEGQPAVSDAHFSPAFSDKLYFVYSGKKQNSGHQIALFDKNALYNENQINEISALSERIAATERFSEFCQCIKIHEDLMSGILNIKPVKSQYFSDFEGEIKSLGAWGGDFIMAASHLPEVEVKSYFKDKGLSTIFAYADMVYHKDKQILNTQ